MGPSKDSGAVSSSFPSSPSSTSTTPAHAGPDLQSSASRQTSGPDAAAPNAGAVVGARRSSHKRQSAHTSVSTPQPVYIPMRDRSSAITFKSVSCGAAHTVALTDMGECFTWGNNRNGRLGRPTPSALSACTPGHIRGLSRVHSVSCGAFHTAARTVSGRCFTWGLGTSGRLGHGDQRDRSSPVAVTGLDHLFVIQVASGGHHTLVLGSPRQPSTLRPSTSSLRLTDNGNEDYSLHDGTNVVCSFGGGSFGKLGHGQIRAGCAALVSARSKCLVDNADFSFDYIVYVAAGCGLGCGYQARRALHLGAGHQGRLGLGGNDNQHIPRRVLGLSPRCAT